MHRFQKWRDALNVALDEKTLLLVIREYVGVIDPQLLARMPLECRRALDASVDLQSAAVTLLHAELAYDGPEDVAQLLHEVAHTFAAASIRLSRLRTELFVPPAKP